MYHKVIYGEIDVFDLCWWNMKKNSWINKKINSIFEIYNCSRVTSEFSVSCCYFEVDVAMNEKYLSIWMMLLHVDTFNLLVCLSLIIFYLIHSLATTNIYVWLCIHSVTFLQIPFLWRLHLVFLVIPHKSCLGMIHISRLFWHESWPIFNSSQ